MRNLNTFGRIMLVGGTAVLIAALVRDPRWATHAIPIALMFAVTVALRCVHDSAHQVFLPNGDSARHDRWGAGCRCTRRAARDVRGGARR